MSGRRMASNVVRLPTGPSSGGRAGRRRQAVAQNVGVGALAAVLFAVFWFSRLEWVPDMRLWRAVGDVAVVLLFLALSMGPAGRVWRTAARAPSWRRAVGIWAAAAALTHAVLVFWGWTQFSVTRLLGYEFVPQLGRTVRLEPGFGLANLLGVVALVWLLVMMVTSFDGGGRWYRARLDFLVMSGWPLSCCQRCGRARRLGVRPR